MTRKDRLWRTLIVTVALAAGTAGVAYATAAVTSATTTIQACQSNKNRLLRVGSDVSACRSDETAVSSNAQGPRGERGRVGVVNANGEASRVVTHAYVGGKYFGSITRRVENKYVFWALGGRLAYCVPDEAVYMQGRAIELAGEGKTIYGSARRRSPGYWRVFGDPAVGAKRLGSVRFESPNRWGVYVRNRRIGAARGADGPAVGLVLIAVCR